MVEPTRTSDSSRVRNDADQQNEPQQKTGPSSFDEILKQSRSTQTPQQQYSDQQGAAHLQKEQAKESRGQELRERKQESKTESHEESRSDEGGSRKTEGHVEGRVEAKGQQKEREGGGQGQGQFGGGRGAMAREAGQTKSKDGAKAAVGSSAQGAFATELKKAALPEALTPQHAQQIVNKVVQYFRIKKHTDGATELDIGFQEEIFKGLRLRLVQKDGRVTLHILTGEGDVRRLFEKSRQDIEDALSAKGIQLTQIVIGEG